MVDDKPEDGAPAEPSRPKREPPTIDLKATAITKTPKETSNEAPKAEAGATGHTAAGPAPQPSQPVSSPISPWAIAPISGAVAAALVIGVGWVLGWPAVQAPALAPQLNAAAIDDLTARLAGLETKASRPAAPVADPASAARMGTSFRYPLPLWPCLPSFRSRMSRPFMPIRMAAGHISWRATTWANSQP